MKTYIVPQVEVSQAGCSTMLALSLQQGQADSSDVLTREDSHWDVWDSTDPEE